MRFSDLTMRPVILEGRRKKVTRAFSGIREEVRRVSCNKWHGSLELLRDSGALLQFRAQAPRSRGSGADLGLADPACPPQTLGPVLGGLGGGPGPPLAQLASGSRLAFRGGQGATAGATGRQRPGLTMTYRAVLPHRRTTPDFRLPFHLVPIVLRVRVRYRSPNHVPHADD